MGLLPPIIAFSLISLGCLAIIAVAMARDEGAGKAVIGFVTVLYAFLWGWQNRRRVRIANFGLDDVMVVLSWSLSTVVILALLMDKA
jgi:hypothetical protein